MRRFILPFASCFSLALLSCSGKEAPTVLVAPVNEPVELKLEFDETKATPSQKTLIQSIRSKGVVDYASLTRALVQQEGFGFRRFRSEMERALPFGPRNGYERSAPL